MTVHARSDLAYVFVSEAHGGCGQPHRRPVEQGAPVKLWSLTCPACEDHLRHDAHWSHTLSEIPETYDETKGREDFDRRGAKDRDQVMALAMAKLAGVELPDTMLRPITGNMPHLPIQVALCKDGHQNATIAKFCTECGVAMEEGVRARVAALEAPAPPAPPSVPTAPANGNGHAPEGWQPPKDSKGRKKPMRDWKLDDLHVLAGTLGVDPAGNRAELIDRLRAAKKEAAGITG